MILRWAILSVLLFLPFLSICVTLLILLPVMLLQSLLCHHIVQIGHVVLTLSRVTDYNNIVLSAHILAAYVIGSVMTRMSRHLRNARQQYHRLETRIEVTCNQLMETAELLRRLRRIISLRVKFILLLAIVACHFLCLRIDLAHSKRHIGGIIIVIEIID